VKRTLYNNVLAKQTIGPAVRGAGTVNGTTVDRVVSFTTGGSVFYRSVGVVIETGTITDGTHAVTIEDSDDGSAWATAATGDVLGGSPAVTSSDDNKVFEFGYTGTKRYVRVSWTQTGGTAANNYSAIVLLGDPSKAPVARS
jgi:hypothetical protein